MDNRLTTRDVYNLMLSAEDEELSLKVLAIYTDQLRKEWSNSTLIQKDIIDKVYGGKTYRK